MVSIVFIVIAGVFGASGVGLAAAAAHASDGAGLKTASEMLIPHAAALLALASFGRHRPYGLWAVGAVLTLGVALFSGDLVARAYLDQRLFPMAAPIGGVAMIVGWIGVALFGLIAALRSKRGSVD